MRYLFIYLSAITALSEAAVTSRHGTAQLRDLLAYPKYDVQFLNDLPLSSTDAGRANALGVEREDEWTALRLGLQDRRRLSDGSDTVPDQDRLQLMPMALVPPGGVDQADFLCLLPSKNSTESQTARIDLDEHVDLDPVQSWAALSHLEGKCLYVQLGWFTYSYCHNQQVRQFRAAKHRHSHPPGGYEPEEDPSYDAYTLGQAYHQPGFKRSSSIKGKGQNVKSLKSTKDKSTDTSPSVSFAQNAASRYLVQKWSDGTMCDKTGRPRETEIQIHCSMTSTDMIYLVKEMAICQYVVVIHSPHLCGLPGFRAPHADVQPAGIQCRQVISDDDFDQWVNGQTRESEPDFGAHWKTPTVQPPAFAGGLDQSLPRPGHGPGSKIRFAWDNAPDFNSLSGPTEGGTIEDKPRLDKNLFGDHESVDTSRETMIELLGELGDMEVLEGDEVVFLSVEQDEEGNILLGNGDPEGESGLDAEAREKLMRALRTFLDGKAAAETEDNRVTEDGDEAHVNEKERYIHEEL